MNTITVQPIRNENVVKMQLNVNADVQQKINNCIENNIFYGVFPVVGDSMECEDKNICIPNGSKVLAIDTNLNLSNGIHNIWHEIPTKKTLLIAGKSSSGKSFFLCKSIISVDAVQGYVLLDSYNKSHGSKWIPFEWISRIFEVVQIVE